MQQTKRINANVLPSDQQRPNSEFIFMIIKKQKLHITETIRIKPTISRKRHINLRSHSSGAINKVSNLKPQRATSRTCRTYLNLATAAAGPYSITHARKNKLHSSGMHLHIPYKMWKKK